MMKVKRFFRNRKITILQGGTVVNDSMFASRKDIAEVVIPEGVTAIGSSAFE